MCDLVDKEPTCFEEAIKQKEWDDAMVEEYQSIIKNDVLEVVPRPVMPNITTLKTTSHTSFFDRIINNSSSLSLLLLVSKSASIRCWLFTDIKHNVMRVIFF